MEFFCGIRVYSTVYDVWYVHFVFDSSMFIVCLRSMLGAVWVGSVSVVEYIVLCETWWECPP